MELVLELLYSGWQVVNEGLVDVNHVQEAVVADKDFRIASHESLRSIELGLVVIEIGEDGFTSDAVDCSELEIEARDIVPEQGLAEVSTFAERRS